MFRPILPTEAALLYCCVLSINDDDCTDIGNQADSNQEKIKIHELGSKQMDSS